jgi:lipopolysaccharide transport system ATP-binding protein
MSAESIVSASSVGKTYAARGLLSLLFQARSEHPARLAEGAALRDVSFELAAGRSLAIVGRNGAGKSTLLRILAGISRPSAGTISVRGSVRSLLDLGAGFLDELTGAENARASLALDGLAGAERDRHVADAIAFSGLGAFAERPVRIYSAGMRLRLAYALAVATRPDVLVADEVLAVGDEDFQRRCSNHVLDFVGSGGTLILASHNLYHVEKLCQRAIWLEGGRVRAIGPAREVTAAYRASIEAEEAERSARRGDPSVAVSPGHDDASECGAIRLTVRTSAGTAVHRVSEGDPFAIGVEGSARVAGGGLADGSLRLEIRRVTGVCVAEFPVAGTELRFSACALLPGRYRARLARAERTIAEAEFDCVGASRDFGMVRLPHRWGRDSA